MVYDPHSRRKVDLSQATRLGLVDGKSLSYCDPETKQQISPIDAARSGLMCLLGRPVLARSTQQAMIQSTFDTDVASAAIARLTEKVTRYPPGVGRQQQPSLLASVGGASVPSVPSTGNTPQGCETKIVESSTEFQLPTVSFEGGVIRATQKMTAVTEKHQSRDAMMPAAGHLRDGQQPFGQQPVLREVGS